MSCANSMGRRRTCSCGWRRAKRRSAYTGAPACVWVLACVVSTAGCTDGEGETGVIADAAQDARDIGDGEVDPTETDSPVYPVPDWVTERPEDHGFSSEGLEQMAQVAEGFESNCLLVTHAGVIIGEWYWQGFDPTTDQPNIYSVTKSITSALVGIAVAQGSLDIDEPVGLVEWQGTESEAITPRNLISNDSGREWSYHSDRSLQFATDQTQFAVDLGQAYPIGTWWEYNNAAIQTLERVLTNAVGSDLGAYAEEHLFQPIGMTAAFGRDVAGNALTYSGVSASCRDLARFGYLYLREGRWVDGEQVVPQAWVAASIEPSTSLNSAYGFMWWLNREGHWILPPVGAGEREEGDGLSNPQAPEESYAAAGAFGQFIAVDPTTDSVWVRLGNGPRDPLGAATGQDLWAAFVAAQLP